MRRPSTRTIAYLAIDIAAVVVCLLHIPSLARKPAVPFTLTQRNTSVIVATLSSPEVAGGLRNGDEVTAFGGKPVPVPEISDLYADQRAVDDTVAVSFRRGAVQGETEVTLVHAHRPGDIAVFVIVGLISWGLGVLVLLRGHRELTTRVLHWALVSLGVTVMIVWEGTDPRGILPQYLTSFLFFLTYASLTACFFIFTQLFPRPGAYARPGFLFIAAVIPFLPLIPIYKHHMAAVIGGSISDYVEFCTWFDVFHVLMMVVIVGGILIFIGSYLRAESSEERRKLLWILFGFCIGPTPFLFLTVLPNLVVPEARVRESYTLAFLAVIPVSLTIAVIKYQVLDITVVIRRTTAYAIVIALLLAVYTLLVGATTYVVGRYTLEWTAAGAILVALLFEPVRRRVQHAVDRRFFRVHYDFRVALLEFNERIKRCANAEELGAALVEHTLDLIPVERIGVFALRQPGNMLRLLAHRNFPMLERRGVKFRPDRLKTGLERPVGLDQCMEPGISYESADAEVFKRWRIALAFPMISKGGDFVGFLVLGPKQSGGRFSIEDVGLLTNVATQAGLEIERIALQHELVREQTKAEQLRQLNQLKSDFVSYVSHELRTPLTSVKMFTELLKNRARGLDRRSKEYLEVIEGEASRLERMVSTILDSARMEESAKRYRLEEADLGELADRAMEHMHYQLTKHKFTVAFKRTGKPLPVRADVAAVDLAITNIIGNAIKYSDARRILRVTVRRLRGWAECSVEDRGRGIAASAIPHIFQRFYRDPSYSDKVEGVGLGLPLVRHIMDGHGGSVDVDSRPGHGSRFTLRFPLAKRTHESGANSRHRRR